MNFFKFVLIFIVLMCNHQVLSYQIKFNTFSKNIRKICTTVIVSTSILTTTSNLPNNNAFAFEASTLFEKSDEASKEAIKNYNEAEKQWSILKKSLNDNQHTISKAENILKTVYNELSKFETKFNKLTTSGDSDILRIQTDIESNTLLTSSKYEKAELSAASNAKPSITAALYQNAQDEANSLSENNIISKAFIDNNYQNKLLSIKIQSILDNINKLQLVLDEIVLEQQSSKLDFSQGVENSYKYCRDSLNDCNNNGNQALSQIKKGK